MALFLKQSVKHRERKVITYRRSGDTFDQNFKNQIQNMDFSEVLEADNVDEAFLKFNNIVYSLYDDCYPLVSKTIVNKRNDTPWMTAAIKQSIKTKNKLYKKFVKKPISYGAIYRKYRNSLTKIIKTSKN